MSETTTLRIAVLISGGGRTLQYLHEAGRAGDIPAEVVLAISSRADAYGVTRAKNLDLDCHVIEPHRLSATRFSQAISELLDRYHIDLVCMGGFLSLWQIPDAYTGRVMNIHPALLPDFGGKDYYGSRVHKAVLEAGRSESGCTVHYADNQYDHGPIIVQRKVPVLAPDTPDTLATRVFEQERHAYIEAIRLHAQKVR